MNRRWKFVKTARRAVVYAALLMVLLAAACVPIPGLPGAGQGGATPQGSGTAPVPLTGNGNVTPAVTVSDQNYDGTTVVVADVVSDGPGWMVIHSQLNGVVGPVIGFVHVNPGDNKNVTVKVDPKQTTPEMYAMLHLDKGKVGTYEFPGPDIPASVDGKMVSPPFKATKQTAGLNIAPVVTVNNQVVQNGKVTIAEVDSPTPAWIAIHVINPDGTSGDDIGFSAVNAGKNTNVTVTVDPTRLTQTLFAMLHADDGEIGTYEYPQHDQPEQVNGEMVGMPFGSDGKPPSANAKMVMPGMAQGAAPTPTGAAETSEVYPTASPAAGMAGMGGPTATSPAQAGAAAQATVTPTPAMVMATPSSDVTPLVKVSDQPLVNGMVKVDEVASGGPGWVVIYTTGSNGFPDQVIGYAPVQKGDNKNVMVKVDPAKAQGKLYAQLHVDAGQVGTFEFPGADAPLMIGVQMIAGTFNVTAPVAQAPKATATATQMPAMPAPTATMDMGNGNGGGSSAGGSSATGPFIKAADQPIINSTVIMPEVFSLGESWLVIHRQNGDGSEGAMVGFVRVHDGDNTNVVVWVDTRFTSTTMYAMLHSDKGKIGKLEFPGPDEPVMANGVMVNVPFVITGNRDADVVINLSSDTSGTPHLVDGHSMSLYLSLKDKPNQSNCTGDCLVNFKPLVASGRVVAGSGVASNKLGILLDANGTRQVTYAGQPLYTYMDDAKPGDINGQGLDGTWFLVNP